MIKGLTFVSERGRIYDLGQVRGLVLSILRKRWKRSLVKDWIYRVDRRFNDATWIEPRNGRTPGSIAFDLGDLVIGLEN